MKYQGTIRTIKDEVIQVIIVTNGDKSKETELTFASESPISICQTSDGIFAPIKSRSCTIKIVSKDVYFDIYSSVSHGTSIVVNNLTTCKCIFFGFVTPCTYNQPYLYRNEIEIEGVDAISTLQDFKYTYSLGSERNTPIASIIQHLIQVAGYNGKVYIPYLGNKKASNNLPTQIEYINDDIFFKDGEASTCYEVLEEICSFYGFSCVPDGNDVFFIDYEVVVNHNTNNADVYGDLNGSGKESFYIPSIIKKDDYAGDDQNIEMDEVYNKVSIKADVYEVKDDDLGIKPTDEMKSGTYYNMFTTASKRSDGVQWTIASRYFEFRQGTYGGWSDNSEEWQTIVNTNSVFDSFGYKLTDNFTERQQAIVWANMDFPYSSGYLYNYIVGQCCLPTQQFGYESTKEMPYSTNWTDMLSFFTQGYWMHKYYNDNNISNTYQNLESAWSNDFYEKHFGGTYPVLYYTSKKYVNYSPASSGQTSYLCIQGNLFFQRNCSYDKVNYNLWDIKDTYCGGMNYPITEVGCHSTDNAKTRKKSDSSYNKGWNTLKVKLSIGNKYWSGSYWTSSETTFWIPYHKEEVVSDDECLIWTGWNKPVTNHNYTYKVNKDAFVIPITNSDALCGKLRIQIYMPRIPWDNQLYAQDGKLKVKYEKIPPVVFMKNFGITLCSTDNSDKWYNVFEDEESDDVIYSNTINGSNVTEMDDLELKINTYNDQKPIAKSYIMEQMYSGNYKYHTEGFHNSLSGKTQRQELNLIDKYVSHYSSPKKIYNCVVHGYKAPYECVSADAISGKYIVDEQEYDVKADVNNLKLVEY